MGQALGQAPEEGSIDPSMDLDQFALVSECVALEEEELESTDTLGSYGDQERLEDVVREVLSCAAELHGALPVAGSTGGDYSIESHWRLIGSLAGEASSLVDQGTVPSGSASTLGNSQPTPLSQAAPREGTVDRPL